MKSTINSFLLLFVSLMVGVIVKRPVLMAQNPPHSASDRVIEDPDVDPMYTGGTAEMHRFISNTLRYPTEADGRELKGLVVYTFVVEKDGTLSNFNNIHRADSLLNAEALRILKQMPPWRPARYKGEIVRAEAYVPMYFRFNKNSTMMAANSSTSEVATTQAYAKTNREFLDQNEIFTIVDQMPQYVYGEQGLAEFISHNMRYPIEAQQEGVEGRILCSFIVGTDGTISNIEVVEGLHPQLNNEAIRVLGLMPRWNPGENGGEKVNVKCFLPIDFSIDEEPIPAS